MKSFWMLLFAVMFFAPQSQADFGEIDLVVRESVEAFFASEGFSVEMSKLEYVGEPKSNGDQLSVRSSVWAEQRQISPNWGWYDCTTTLKIKARGAYEDLGTDCFFDFE